jgi:YD repeat-containing protein
VTNPRGFVRRVTFNTDRFETSDTAAVGTALERTTTIARQSGTNWMTSITDPLNRRTDFTYDAFGHVLTTTRLAGTGNAVTTEPHLDAVLRLVRPAGRRDGSPVE